PAEEVESSEETTSDEESDNLENDKPEDNLDKYTLIALEDGSKVRKTSYAKDNIDLENAVFSDDQNYVVEHIYTEEQDELIKEVYEKDSLTEEELDSIDFVEDFDLSSCFGASPVSEQVQETQQENIENINEEEIEIPDLDDDSFISSDDTSSLMSDDDLELPEIEDEEVKEVELLKEDNVKDDEINIQYNNKDVIVPDIDNVDYIDESNYINEIEDDNDVIQLSGNELDLITKDFEINENASSESDSEQPLSKEVTEPTESIEEEPTSEQIEDQPESMVEET
ncbi:hypothetical protein, partial [Brachyspira pulli]|uniref:hypothetical protein n=1 Tax=Brachyspira pulli TaxID=310721 RepID=UPI003004D7B8